MTRTSLLCACLLALFSMLGGTAHAVTNQRSWVASNGSGTQCTRTAPCNNMQAAHDNTDPGGEINCIDGYDYGILNVTKTITIDCAGTQGGMTDAGSIPTIIINHQFVDVTLRHLDITCNGTGEGGVQFLQGSSLHVEHCRIYGFGLAQGIGIQFSPSSAAQLYVSDSVFEMDGNQLSHAGGGIVVQPTGSGQAGVFIERTLFKQNVAGVLVDGTGNGRYNRLVLNDSTIVGSASDGISLKMTFANIINTKSQNNGGAGLLAAAQTVVVLGSSTLFGNVTGLSILDSSQIFSHQNNQIGGNNTDGSPTYALPTK